MTNNQPSIYDDHGLLYVWFEFLYSDQSSDKNVANNKPNNSTFGLSRVPIKGELLKVNNCLWIVEEVIHHNMSLEMINDLQTYQKRLYVATIQVRFDSFA